MNAREPISVSWTLRLVLGVAALAAATGAAFASWMDHGAGIFMTLVESGLAWCF